LYFAGRSTQWGGAPCFIDTVASSSTPALARAWLITWGQFEDVVAQENGRSTPSIELGRGLDELEEGFSRALGRGRYDNVLCLGRIEGHPVLAFTSPGTMADAVLGAPAPGYLEMLIVGLRESRHLDDDALVTYLGAAPGCSADLVSAVLGRPDREVP
jgi:hypothetical protein